jgi:uncharacterized protein (DUF983 family)
VQSSSDRLARLSAAARAFDQRASKWPLWRRLVIFIPVFLVVSFLMAMTILAIFHGLASIRL